MNTTCTMRFTSKFLRLFITCLVDIRNKPLGTQLYVANDIRRVGLNIASMVSPGQVMNTGDVRFWQI